MSGDRGLQPWDAEFSLDAAAVAALIAAQFPGLAPVEPRLVDSGWDCDAWRVGEDLVFRLPRREFGVPFVRNEIRWLPHLAPVIDVPFPEPVHVGVASPAFPYPFIGARWVHGRTADRARPDAAARLRMAPRLAGLLRRLHALDDIPDDAPRDPIDKGNPVRLRSIALRHWEKVPPAERPLTDDVFRALVDDLATTPPRAGGPRWLHGDLYPRHLVVDGAGDLAGIIDWGDLHAGDPAVDLSIAWSFLDAEARAVFLSAYGPVSRALRRRARLRCLLLGSSLLSWGLAVGDDDLADAGRAAFAGGGEEA